MTSHPPQGMPGNSKIITSSFWEKSNYQSISLYPAKTPFKNEAEIKPLKKKMTFLPADYH